MDYGSIPKFLTNGKSEVVLNAKSKSDLLLNEINYNYLIEILNRLISHLNKNRIVLGLLPVPTFSAIKVPDKVDLKKLGKKEEDYMDSMILDYWATYVIEQSDEYFGVKADGNKD